MTKELERKLFEKYPKFFQHREDPRGSAMYFGFECSDGWYPLLCLICEFLERRYPHWSKQAQKDFFVTQVKEKFGGLRFYTSVLPDGPPPTIRKRIRQWFRKWLWKLGMEVGRRSRSLESKDDWGPTFDLLEAAETVSMELCEVCGKPGTQNIDGWIQTLCKKHRRAKGGEEDAI